MQFDKENYLSVTYEANKGFHLKWNFKDLFQYTNYFHHFFVITDPNPDHILTFLTAYYKKMKSGDLMTVLYYDHKKQ